ncbi:hypothetical protein HMPREF1982_01163 [Clostridiales bacterium oral taxon 876 str. F0540]|nr:hypothetical protein HMPREF1982_01163 [Clostridiales bacterium oral taxon 876 str. F0540]
MTVLSGKLLIFDKGECPNENKKVNTFTISHPCSFSSWWLNVELGLKY